jgi:hypothetical protein
MTIENITLAILGMEKYLGLVSLIVVAIGMQFYEPNGKGYFTNILAKVLTYLALYGILIYVIISIIKDFLEQ